MFWQRRHPGSIDGGHAKETPMKVVIHGGTGAQGSAVASELESRGHTAVRLSRRGSAPSVAADLNDAESLARAYRGADAVFVHLPIPTDPTRPVVWTRNVLHALRVAAVSRVVYSTSGTSLRDGETGPHPILQGAASGVRAFYAGLTHTVPEVVALAPRLFLDNLLLPFVAGPVVAEGVLAYPLAADKLVSWTSHGDMARVAADALEGTVKPGAYDVGLPPMTGPELAASVGEGIGKLVRYDPISPDEFARRAKPIFGAQAAAGVGALYDAYANDPSRAIADDAPRIAGSGSHRSAARWAAGALGRP